ncbi:DNA-binding protein [Clostridia bacterium]|nr:DNA-binding protein [Clostridia bacterium]
MKVVFDSNIAINVYANQGDLAPASLAALKLAESGEVDGYINANSITDIYYILKRNIEDEKKVRVLLKTLIAFVTVVDVTSADVDAAFELKFEDYEDALLAQCSKRIGAGYIVTRNMPDFRKSPVQAITPENFIRKFIEENKK